MDIKNSPLPPRVTVMLDRERELKYPLPSIWVFEDLTGLDVLSGGLTTAEEFYGGTVERPATIRQRMNRVVDMLWAGLLADDPAITREFVLKYVYPRDLPALDDKCAKAFLAALAPARAAISEDASGSPLAAGTAVQ